MCVYIVCMCACMGVLYSNISATNVRGRTTKFSAVLKQDWQRFPPTFILNSCYRIGMESLLLEATGLLDYEMSNRQLNSEEGASCSR